MYGPGGFSLGGLLGKGDGSGTDRSTYHLGNMHAQMHAEHTKGEDKTFGSPSGGGHHGSVTQGAVSALNLAGAGLAGGAQGHMLDNSQFMKNILSTPSSGKTKSGISTEDAQDLQKHQ